MEARRYLELSERGVNVQLKIRKGVSILSCSLVISLSNHGVFV